MTRFSEEEFVRMSKNDKDYGCGAIEADQSCLTNRFKVPGWIPKMVGLKTGDLDMITVRFKIDTQYPERDIMITENKLKNIQRAKRLKNVSTNFFNKFASPILRVAVTGTMQAQAQLVTQSTLWLAIHEVVNSTLFTQLSAWESLTSLQAIKQLFVSIALSILWPVLAMITYVFIGIGYASLRSRPLTWQVQQTFCKIVFGGLCVADLCHLSSVQVYVSVVTSRGRSSRERSKRYQNSLRKNTFRKRSRSMGLLPVQSSFVSNF